MDFIYQDPYPILKDDTTYKKLTSDFVKIEKLGDREILTVDPKGLELLAEEAMKDVSFMLRSSHLQKLRNIIDDPEATDNDRFVAYNLLQNAVVAVEQLQEVIALHQHVVEFQKRQPFFQPCLKALCRKHPVDRKMHANLPQKIHVIKVQKPIGIIDDQRPTRRKIYKPGQLLLKACDIMVNYLLCHHLPHVSPARRSPIIAVPPPTSAIGRCPARCICAMDISCT